jgi:hypothetical protein
MRAFNVLLSVLVSLAIGLLVLEGGLRLIGLGPRKSILHHDALLGWSKVPGLATKRKMAEGKVAIAINELGLHDDPLSDPKKPANTFRVVMLGDSFTQGFTVGREDLFVDHLERWWRAENRRVDVINAGTEAWSTDQEVAWLVHNGARFEPDLVLLFPYENDLYWNGEPLYVMRDTPKPRFRPDGTLEERELVDVGPPPLGDRFALTLLAKPFWGERPDARHFFRPEGYTRKRPLLKEWGAVLNTPPDFMSDALARTQGALIALKKKCDELGARVFVVPLPSHSAIDPAFRARFGQRQLGLPADRWSPDRPVDTFLALAAKAGIETLDPRSALRAHAQNGRQLYFTKDWHLNPEGNRALATFLHDELDRPDRKVFPEGHRPAPGAAIALPDHAPRGGVPAFLLVFGALWLVLTTLYLATYRDEPKWQPPLKVAALLAVVFTIVLGGKHLVGLLPPRVSLLVLVLFVLGILGFVAYKLGHRLATIAELLRSFVLRGHWYLMPLVIVLITIGSLLVVAASSPLVAPFIYTLF